MTYITWKEIIFLSIVIALLWVFTPWWIALPITLYLLLF